MQPKNENNIALGLAVGAVGGLLATWVMSQYQALFASPGGSSDEEEPATVKAATAISTNIFGHKLTPEERKIAGPLVHYAFGTLNGAAYGALAETLPAVTIAGGLLFGASLWLIADEAAVPALGMSKSPANYPLSTHLYSLTSHLLYGLTTDLTRRVVRRLTVAVR